MVLSIEVGENGDEKRRPLVELGANERLQAVRCSSLLLSMVLWLVPLVALAGTEAGVGRLNFGGHKETTNCTAFLTERGHLVTAAHCLNLPEDAKLHFLERYDRGGWTRHLELLLDWFARDGLKDLAVICQAVPADGGALAVSERPLAVGEQLEVWGYGAPRSHVLQQRTCPLLRASNDGTLVLGCDVSGGTSGAPVLRRKGAGREVVGVVWGTDVARSYAHRLTSELLEHHCGGS